MIAGLILAAGESSRMGKDKALLRYRGRTFLENIVATLREAGIDRITVVLGHHAEEIQREVDFTGAEVVINRHYRRGQTSSLQAGLRAIERDDLEAFVLFLVDHPAVTADTVRALATAFDQSRGPVIVPTFKGQRGHPVLVSRSLLSELLRLNPDEGANTVVRKYREATEFVKVEDEGVVLDVDDLETYQRLR